MRKLGILSVILVFAMSTLACQISSGHKPPRLLTISPAEAKLFENALGNPKINPTTGVITITISESQVSSYLVYNLVKNNSANLLNPQVFFEPGQIHVFATYAGDLFQIDGRIVMTAVVEENQPKFTIVSVDFGPLPLPASLTRSLTDQLDKEVTNALARNSTGYKLENVSINTGTLLVTLKKK